MSRRGTVRVQGLREMNRAFKTMAKETQPLLKRALTRAAEPVAQTAQSLLSGYAGTSLGTIQPKVLARGVYVYQNARKVTGLRKDFGALQMRKGLIPALDEHTDDILRAADHALDEIAHIGGF